MKPLARSNYPVRVVPPWGDADRQDDPVYAGVFEVQFNYDVRFLFVEDLERSAEALVGMHYAVTPDDGPALEREELSVVRVPRSQFVEFLSQLASLYDGPAGIRPGVLVDTIGEVPVIGFLRSTVATSRYLTPYHQRILGLASPS